MALRAPRPDVWVISKLMRKTAGLWGVSLVLLIGGAGTAFAQDDGFDDIVRRALEAYKSKRYAQAITGFERAYDLRAEPELVYNIARAYEKSLKSAEAIGAYERFLELPGTTADLRAKARGSLDALRREEAARNAPPPPPPPVGVVPGGPPPPPPPPPGVTTERPEKVRTLEYVLIGAGATALVVGTIFGVIALQKNGDFNDQKDADPTDPALPGLKDDVNSNALIADVAIIGGVVLGAVGVTLLLVGSDDADADALSLAPAIGRDGGGLTLTGRF